MTKEALLFCCTGFGIFNNLLIIGRTFVVLVSVLLAFHDIFQGEVCCIFLGFCLLETRVCDSMSGFNRLLTRTRFRPGSRKCKIVSDKYQNLSDLVTEWAFDWIDVHDMFYQPRFLVAKPQADKVRVNLTWRFLLCFFVGQGDRRLLRPLRHRGHDVVDIFYTCRIFYETGVDVVPEKIRIWESSIKAADETRLPFVEAI